MKEQLVALTSLIAAVLLPVGEPAGVLLSPLVVFDEKQNSVLVEHHLDLTTREANPQISQGFADNILLSLHYLAGETFTKNIDWEEIRQPFKVEFVLEPGDYFAFHENVLPQFADPAVTMKALFLTTEGYQSVAGLGGNGVCHLASLFNWVASEAGLAVTALASHDFAPIPEVPREFGTSIRSQSATQNLYLENSLDFPIVFEIKTDNQAVVLTIKKSSS